MIRFYKIFIILSILAMTMVYESYAILGLHIRNQTNASITISNIGKYRILNAQMTPGSVHYFSEFPVHLIVYGPQGSCSHFYGIEAQSGVFSDILIRASKQNPACYVIGMTGKTRQSNSRVVPPIVFDPTFCKKNCWNPSNGWIAPDIVSSTDALQAPGAGNTSTLARNAARRI